MKNIFMAVVFVCVLSLSAFAGDIPTVPGPQPPPTNTTNVSSMGEIPSDGSEVSLSNAALSVLLTALGLASF